MRRESALDHYRFCPECAGQLVPRVLSEGEPPRLACVSCSFTFRAGPRLAAATVFPHEGGLVLVRRALAPEQGRWTFPGGFVDLGETVTGAALRETVEETGLRVGLTGILDVYSFSGHDVVLVVYAADVTAGTLRAGSECSEVRAFKPESLPWDELAFASTRAALTDYMRRFFPRVRLPR